MNTQLPLCQFSRKAPQRFPILFLVILLAEHAFGLDFSVTFPSKVYAGPFSGRVVVYVSPRMPQPHAGMYSDANLSGQEYTYSRVVFGAGPDDPIQIGEDAASYPTKMARLPRGRYFVQAFVDRNLGGRDIRTSAGNLASPLQSLILDANLSDTIELVCTEPILERPFRETQNMKAFRMESKLLSSFYGRKTWLNACVGLPKDWATNPTRKYPVVYEVPGFGGWYFDGRAEKGVTRNGEPFLNVVLDSDCPGGHSAFADSATNGPWGQSLVTELIPALERQFRAIGTPESRFLIGHSSGGWSALWLQIAYPDTFGGCWSTSPDPVDFRAFGRLDLYQPNGNFFVDPQGQPVPAVRGNGKSPLSAKQLLDIELPLRGGQYDSFEHVFGPRGVDGEPLRLFDRSTGKIDSVVAEHWRKYDIGEILRTHWAEISPKVRGKIHVFVGDADTFFLDGAVRLLQKDLQELGSDASITIVAGDHYSYLTPMFRGRVDQEIAQRFRENDESSRP